MTQPIGYPLDLNAPMVGTPEPYSRLDMLQDSGVDIYECSFCGLLTEDAAECETCDHMACPECAESAQWSDEAHKCAACKYDPT